VEQLEVNLQSAGATRGRRRAQILWLCVEHLLYKNALQDQRADPPALGQRFPPAKQLSTEPAE